jgi:ABC-type protease/lipase transport system fused ATPase/permease subunit
MFSGTIRDNICLGRKDLDMNDIVEACQMAQAHDFINKLPLRYETHLEKNATNLSGGQKQRLAIASCQTPVPLTPVLCKFAWFKTVSLKDRLNYFHSFDLSFK